MIKRNTQQRRHAIISLLNEQGEVSVDDLSQRFATSEVTIRKDLAELERSGVLLRRYGGAISLPSEILAEEVEEGLDLAKKYEKLNEEHAGNLPADVRTDVLADMSDWLGDIVVYCASEARRWGLPLSDVLNVIMESNFSKLGADGKPSEDLDFTRAALASAIDRAESLDDLLDALGATTSPWSARSWPARRSCFHRSKSPSRMPT